MYGGSLLESFVGGQATQAQSSGEAEFYAIGSGAARALTVKHVLNEMEKATFKDVQTKVVIWTDSAAARGMSMRHGVGRVRHLQTRWLWHQDLVRNGDLVIEKIGTDDQVADIGTKPMEKERLARHCASINLKSLRKAGWVLPKVLLEALSFLGETSPSESTPPGKTSPSEELVEAQ